MIKSGHSWLWLKPPWAFVAVGSGVKVAVAVGVSVGWADTRHSELFYAKRPSLYNILGPPVD
ncbi:MAG: hypothetical protein M1401_07590 [Chloroflexi bacterium]|nr:hypothetical protein [Chloroflexota bacterium]